MKSTLYALLVFIALHASAQKPAFEAPHFGEITEDRSSSFIVTSFEPNSFVGKCPGKLPADQDGYCPLTILIGNAPGFFCAPAIVSEGVATVKCFVPQQPIPKPEPTIEESAPITIFHLASDTPSQFYYLCSHEAAPNWESFYPAVPGITPPSECKAVLLAQVIGTVFRPFLPIENMITVPDNCNKIGADEGCVVYRTLPKGVHQ